MARGFKTGGRNFQPGQSGNPKGKKPVDYDVLTIKLLTAKELALACSVLIYASQDELDRIDRDRSEPKLHRIISAALNKAHEEGDFSMLNQILDRVIGKPKELAMDADEDEQKKGLAILAEIRKVIDDRGNERKA